MPALEITLEQAIKKIHLKSFNNIITSEKLRLDHYDKFGCNFLHLAIRIKNQTSADEKLQTLDLMISALIERVDIDAKEKPKIEQSMLENCALGLAIIFQDFTTFRKLLDKNASLSVLNKNNVSPIILAACVNDIKFLTTIVAYAENNNQSFLPDGERWTALHQVIEEKSIEKLNFLLPKIKDLKDERFSNILNHAIIKLTKLKKADESSDEIIKKLYIDKQAAYSKDEKLGTPYFCACNQGNTYLADFFLETELKYIDSSGDTALHRAIKYGTYELFCKFLHNEKGITFDINVKNTINETLLHYTTGNQRSDEDSALFIEKLLNQPNISVDAFSDKGYSALAYAILCNKPKCAKLLLPKSINLTPPPSHATLLHLAAQHGVYAVIDDLVKRGLDVNSLNFADETPLHCAIKFYQIACVIQLCKTGSNLYLRDRVGNTPIHLACEIYEKACKNLNSLQSKINSLHAISAISCLLKALIEKENAMDVLHIKNNKGETARQLLLKINDEKIKDLLNILTSREKKPIAESSSTITPTLPQITLPLDHSAEATQRAHQTEVQNALHGNIFDLQPLKKNKKKKKKQQKKQNIHQEAKLTSSSNPKNSTKSNIDTPQPQPLKNDKDDKQQTKSNSKAPKPFNTVPTIQIATQTNSTVLSKSQQLQITYFQDTRTAENALIQHNKLRLIELKAILQTYKPKENWEVGVEDFKLISIPGSQWLRNANQFHEKEIELKMLYKNIWNNQCKQENKESITPNEWDGIYIVGSTPIQLLVGPEVVVTSDIDILIVNDYIKLEDIQTWANQKGYKAKPRGKTTHSLEISFPESQCQPLSIVCINSDSFKSGLYNRDYTINAIALQILGSHVKEAEKFHIISVWEWLNDLIEGIIRTIILAKNSYEADFSRKIRGITLESKLKVLNFKLAPKTIEALIQATHHSQKPSKLLHHCEKLLLLVGLRETIQIFEKYHMFIQLKSNKAEIDKIFKDSLHFPFLHRNYVSYNPNDLKSLIISDLKSLITSFINTSDIESWEQENSALLISTATQTLNENNNSPNTFSIRFFACILFAGIVTKKLLPSISKINQSVKSFTNSFSTSP